MKKIIYLLSFIAFVSVAIGGIAQTGNGSGIQFQVTQADSVQVSFSWNSPSAATSCFIEYNRQYGSNTYPVQPFPANAFSIPRASPIGPWEEFVIHFSLPGGNTQSDTILVRHVFGGVVLIEEDIFCIPVFEGCAAGATSYYFVNSCLVATNAAVCGFTWTYRELEPEYLAPGYEYFVDSTVFSTLLLDYLAPMAADPTNLDVQYCEVMDPDAWYIAPGTGGRKGKSISTSELHASPNPFSQFIHIKPQSPDNTSGLLKVQDMLGRTIFQQQFDAEKHPEGFRIDTKAWKAGMYLIVLDEGKRQRLRKWLNFKKKLT